MRFARLALALISFLLNPIRALWRAALHPVWRSRHDRDLIRLGLATMYRGRLIPVMRGGDGRDEPLFTDVPADLTGVEDEQLSELRDNLLNRIREVAASRRDPEIVGELTQAEVLAALEQATTQLELIKDELTAREAEESGYDERVAELAAQAGVELTAETNDETDGDPEAMTDEPSDEAAAEPEAQPAPEPVTASASTRRPLPAAGRRHRPKVTEVDSRGLRVTQYASAVGTPFDAGEILDRRSLGNLLTDVVKRGRVKPGQTAVLASATYEYPDEFTLSSEPGAGEINTDKVQRALGDKTAMKKSLVASGAPCAPLTPIYELPGVETAARPVRDALPSFQATRGGVILGTNPVMGDLAGAVGVVTAAENAAGGTSAVKSCLRVECPQFDSVEVDSIFHCREYDNLRARAYPEGMAREDELVRAEQARIADSRLLTLIAAGSTALTGGFASPGAVSAYLGDLIQAAAQYRSSNRMATDAQLQALAPAWLIDLLALDIARGQFDRFQTDAQIGRLLADANITPTYYLDGSETASDGQIFDRATDGALIGWPGSVETFLFAPGTWLHLDAGVLELGIVRDSVLNATNDFQIFGETWESVAKVGGDSYVITTDVCPNGEVSTPAAAPSC